MPTTDKETAFADLIKNYENQWVAIDERDGVEFVVGHGNDAVEAARDAESKGFPNAMLCLVPSFSSTFIPSTVPTALTSVSVAYTIPKKQLTPPD